MTMTVEGLQRLNARIAAIPQAIRDAAREALETSTDEMVALVKRNIPKLSGDLGSTVRKADGRTELTIDVMVGDKEHPYAAALEFGHMDHGKHVAAEPYWFPALRLIRKKHRSRISRAVRKAIRSQTADGAGGGDD